MHSTVDIVPDADLQFAGRNSTFTPFRGFFAYTQSEPEHGGDSARDKSRKNELRLRQRDGGDGGGDADKDERNIGASFVLYFLRPSSLSIL